MAKMQETEQLWVDHAYLRTQNTKVQYQVKGMPKGITREQMHVCLTDDMNWSVIPDVIMKQGWLVHAEGPISIPCGV